MKWGIYTGLTTNCFQGEVLLIDMQKLAIMILSNSIKM